jgi:hypothetical protein
MRIFALRTDAEKLDSVSEDAVTVEIILYTPQKVKRGAVNIVHPTAFHAANMMVGSQIAIESGLFAAELQLLYHARPRQQVQVAIHRSQADFREAVKDNPVNARCGGVRAELLKLLQNHLPLLRVALDRLVFHGFSLTNGNYYCFILRVKREPEVFSKVPVRQLGRCE